jgi:hypothetical protein
MTPEIEGVLREIPELAWVSVHRTGVRYVPPLLNRKLRYVGPVLRFLEQYALRRSFEGEFFLCLYDGWREYSMPYVEPRFANWNDVDKDRFRGRGAAGEPRFRHLDSNGVFPVLPLPVLAFCRHKGDLNTLLIPDPSFLTGEVLCFLERVTQFDVAWNLKTDRSLFWRGGKHISHYPEQATLHHREMITSSQDPRVDAAYSSTVPLASQLKHKYLIDADGYVSAWTGLFWKLFSNSVPVKLPSHWEQWYYQHLRDRINVVMLDSDYTSIWEWLKTNDELAREIAIAGQKLARTLTYEYALETYVIA